MRPMVSGAGHDAAYTNRVMPTTMIFVPCAGGISHNEAESTSLEECAAGAQVLLNAVLEYDQDAGGGEGRWQVFQTLARSPIIPPTIIAIDSAFNRLIPSPNQ